MEFSISVMNLKPWSRGITDISKSPGPNTHRNEPTDTHISTTMWMVEALWQMLCRLYWRENVGWLRLMLDDEIFSTAPTCSLTPGTQIQETQSLYSSHKDNLFENNKLNKQGSHIHVPIYLRGNSVIQSDLAHVFGRLKNSMLKESAPSGIWTKDFR